MHEMDKRKGDKEVARSESDVSNLFSSSMLLIFKNVKNIIIKTTERGGEYSYSVCMKCLLSLIEKTSVEKVILKAETLIIENGIIGFDDDDTYNWICDLWKSDEKRI